jgi:hypothetical protein
MCLGVKKRRKEREAKQMITMTMCNEERHVEWLSFGTLLK